MSENGVVQELKVRTSVKVIACIFYGGVIVFILSFFVGPPWLRALAGGIVLVTGGLLLMLSLGEGIKKVLERKGVLDDGSNNNKSS